MMLDRACERHNEWPRSWRPGLHARMGYLCVQVASPLCLGLGCPPRWRSEIPAQSISFSASTRDSRLSLRCRSARTRTFPSVGAQRNKKRNVRAGFPWPPLLVSPLELAGPCAMSMSCSASRPVCPSQT